MVMPDIVSTVQLFFTGLFAYYHDQRSDCLQLGVLNNSHHNLNVLALVEARDGVQPINIATPMQKTQIVLKTVGEPSSGIDLTKLEPMITLDGPDMHNDVLSCAQGAFTPSLLVYCGVFSPAVVWPVRLVSPPNVPGPRLQKEVEATMSTKAEISLMNGQKVVL